MSRTPSFFDLEESSKRISKQDEYSKSAAKDNEKWYEIIDEQWRSFFFLFIFFGAITLYLLNLK